VAFKIVLGKVQSVEIEEKSAGTLMKMPEFSNVISKLMEAHLCKILAGVHSFCLKNLPKP